MHFSRKLLGTSALLIAAVCAQNASAATAEQEAVYSLAQGCYALKSNQNGNFLKRFGDGNKYYHFQGNQASASKFFFKPARLGEFMLRDVSGQLLSAHKPDEGYAADTPNPDRVWAIAAEAKNSGGYNYTFRNNNKNFALTVGGNQSITLVPVQGCTPFPEAPLNMVRTNVADTNPAVGEPIRGFSDIHVHLSSYLFFGGNFLNGQPAHPYGIASALPDSAPMHGPSGSTDLLGNIMAHGTPVKSYDTRGYPDFPFWPNQKTVSHQFTYYRWIERAHKAGMKLLVSDVVENSVLCRIHTDIQALLFKKAPKHGCDTMQSVRRQIAALYEMQDYIDAQEGGPGKGFFRIVRTPLQARQVISQGKMAVIIGMETSEVLSCGAQDERCTRESIDKQLAELKELGMQIFFPIHRFNNRFGGALMADGVINVGQKISSGQFFETKQCKAPLTGQEMSDGFPMIGQIPVLKQILKITGSPYYHEPWNNEENKHCNQAGLTDMGAYLVNRMIDEKFLISVDHLSYESADAILKIAEARNYAGVVSAHSHILKYKNDTPSDLTFRIAELGGMTSVYNFPAPQVSDLIDKNNVANRQAGRLEGVGFSTDANGMAEQAPKRANNANNGVNYPFTTFDGKYKVYKQKTGNRTFDYNREGLAHYGLLAEHVEDIKNAGTESAYNSILNSAEAYIQMWERAVVNTSTNYKNPLPAYFQLRESWSNRCIDVPGNDDKLLKGAQMQLWNCFSADADDQRWFYNAQTKKIHNKADNNLCLSTSGNTLSAGRTIVLERCNLAVPFVFGGQNSIRPAQNRSYVLATRNGENGGKLELQYANPSKPHQKWSKRLENIDLRWVEYRDGRSGLCMTTAGAGVLAKVTMQVCNGSNAQQWMYNAKTKELRSKIAANRCLDLPYGNVNDGNQLQTYSCNGAKVQKFLRVGASFRSAVQPGQILDAAGDKPGAKVVIHKVTGGANQSWNPNQAWPVGSDMADIKWVQYRDGRANKCLTVKGARAVNGAKLELNNCIHGNAQKWYYNINTKKIHSRLKPTMCVDAPGGNIDSGVRLQIWQCLDSAKGQRFNRVGNSFRIKGQLIDANGTNDTSKVTMYHITGGSNQSWFAH